MRKILLLLTIISVFVLSGICGYYIYKANTNNQTAKLPENTQKNNEVNIVYPSILTNYSEEKVSPNATLIIKKRYQKCGHTTKDYAEIPSELVNMTEKEVKDTYPDWEVKEFTANEVIILKEVAGICGEHYLVKDKDGLVAIYVLDGDEKETLSEVTEISTEYLTDDDKEKLKDGIKAIGKEELNSLIEDYE